MAVISAIPGISVHIRVDGQIATEYATPEGEADNDSDVPSHCCYIQSITGARFAIEVTVARGFKISPPRGYLAANITLDGVSVAAKGCYKNDLVRREHALLTCTSVMEPSNKKEQMIERDFVFGHVVTVEDANKERVARDATLAKSLGTIEVAISIAVADGFLPHRPVNLHEKGEFQLAEKSLKGRELSHGTAFSSGRAIRAPRFLKLKNRKHVCRFIFKYQSHDALKRGMIIPPYPSSTPSLDEIKDLPTDKIRELAREMIRIKQATREESTVKRERENSTSGNTNFASRPLKMVKLRDGTEAIDLTDE